MRQSGSFEYQDLEEVTKLDSRSEVPGEDGSWGIPDTMGIRRKNGDGGNGGDEFRTLWASGGKMAAEEFQTWWTSGGKWLRRIPDAMGVRKKMAAENSGHNGRPEENSGGEFQTRWASGGKWQRRILDALGIRRKRAAEEFRTRWTSKGKWRRRNSGHNGRPGENGGKFTHDADKQE